MRSLVIFEVEHGETTDPLHQFIEEAQRQGYEIPDCQVKDYTVKVDLPECFVLEGGQPKPVNYAEGMSDTDIAQALIDMDAFDAWLEDTSTLPEFYNHVMSEAAQTGNVVS